MNTDLEERLTESMRRTVGGIELTGDVLDRAKRRHRRRTMLVRTGYGLGVAGIAGVLAFGLLPGVGGPPAPQPQPQPAGMRLANAAAASDNISYRMRLQVTIPSGQVLSTCEGAFDPRTDTGYARCPQDDSVMTELLIDGTRFSGGEPPLGPLPPDKGEGETYGRYGQYPGTFHRLSVYGEPGSVLGSAAPDPAALFEALRDANATTTENPDGTLHFEYTTQSADGSTAASGDVTLNADGRIARVAMTVNWQSTVKGRLDSGTTTATLELFDYGVEVRVERPADVVPFR